MSNLQDIKRKIYIDGRIPDILESLGCEYIRVESRGERYVAQLPSRFGSRNKRSVQIRNNELLNSSVRSRNITGDIYTLVGYIEFGYEHFDDVREHIGEIKTWVCETLGYVQFLGFQNEGVFVCKDWNAWLRPIQKSRPKKLHIEDNKVLGRNIMQQFVNIPHIKWINEGININTQRYFDVHVDIETERIVFPVHNKDGEIIGVKGRYFGTDPVIKEDYKYLPIYPYSKSIELFNIHRALPFIKKRNEVIVVEAAKSCLLLTQWGYENCVSTEGKDISQVQVKLLKNLHVPIVFAWDKDVTWDNIKRYTKDFKTRLVYAIYDDTDLLDEKEAPVDKGITVWEKMYESKRKIF
ncbi:MAG: DNA primase [Peptococcales bacterium]|jgi:DNA primase